MLSSRPQLLTDKPSALPAQQSRKSLTRLFRPKSIAVIGGAWAFNVIEQLQRSGYEGEIWPVHPTRETILDLVCYRDINSLPGAPDCAFIGVNRELTVSLISELSAAGAGGAICFASGFREADSDHSLETQDLQDKLVEAAGEMPFLGPNCYGFLNYADNVSLWPDQHGGCRVSSGVGIIAQSSNIAINMTMQQRGLPLAYMITAGNQAQTSVSDIAMELIADQRVTVIGLYLEGFGNIRDFEAMAHAALQAGKKLVALKIGKSEKAQIATMTHTASLAGGSAAASALLKRLGIVEVDSVGVFLETLKLLDKVGHLSSSSVFSVSCSGGEASLMSDLAADSSIEFLDPTPKQQQELAAVLGSKVTLANPLDYHTYIWGDVAGMTECFAAVMRGGFGLNVFVLDIPRADLCDPKGHDCAIESIIAAKQQTNAAVAVIGLLPENISEAVTERFHAAGVATLHGMETGIAAIDAVIRSAQIQRSIEVDYRSVILSLETPTQATYQTLNELEAKAVLSEFGLPVPRYAMAEDKTSIDDASQGLSYPLVLKGLGLAHKTEAGAVILGIDSEQALSAAIENIPNCPQGYLIEEMLQDSVAELIIGVTRDSLGIFLLTMGSGGIFTELLEDTVSTLLPASRAEIESILKNLKIYKVLQGYRGKPDADMNAILNSIEAIANYVEANADCIQELDVNPLIAQASGACAVDALIRLRV